MDNPYNRRFNIEVIKRSLQQLKQLSKFNLKMIENFEKYIIELENKIKGG